MVAYISGHSDTFLFNDRSVLLAVFSNIALNFPFFKTCTQFSFFFLNCTHFSFVSKVALNSPENTEDAVPIYVAMYHPSAPATPPALTRLSTLFVITPTSL